MATKYKFCHYTFSDGSRVTKVVQNYFCQEIFLQIKFRLSVTNFFITECLFSCSECNFHLNDQPMVRSTNLGLQPFKSQ